MMRFSFLDEPLACPLVLTSLAGASTRGVLEPVIEGDGEAVRPVFAFLRVERFLDGVSTKPSGNSGFLLCCVSGRDLFDIDRRVLHSPGRFARLAPRDGHGESMAAATDVLGRMPVAGRGKLRRTRYSISVVVFRDPRTHF